MTIYLDRSKDDVALIQEPWINNNKVRGLGLKGYTLFVANTTEKVRTCVLAKEELNFHLNSSFSNGDMTVVDRIAKGKRKLTLASVYMPYEAADPPERGVQELTRHARSRREDLVLGCDANAHHYQWGSNDINKRGESVFDFITSNDLLICNMGNTPTFRTRDRATVIDITLTNSRSDLVREWRVATDCTFSDHSRITFTLDHTKVKGKPIRIPKRTKWNEFKNHVDGKIGIISGCESSHIEIDKAVDRLTTVCKESYESCCPLIYPGKRKKPKWWNKDLQDQRTTVRKLFNRAKSSRQLEDWNRYKEGFNKYKRDIKRAKRRSWLDYCTSIDSVNELSRFRRILSKDPKAPGYIQRTDGSWTESSLESLSILMETHFPACRQVPEEEAPFMAPRPEGDMTIDREMIDEIVTMDKVVWAIRTFDPYKSPGPDGIFPAMLQNLSDKIISFLVSIFKSCLLTGYTPRGWRKVRVVFIPKAGKASHSKPKDYRPISLSSFLLKTLERLIDLYLRKTIDPNIISGAQHAYLKGKSVESALHDVVGYIERGLHYREYTLAAFLDIEGAFNNIKIEAIRESLELTGIPTLLREWITFMLSSRIISSSIGDDCLRRIVTRGTPQGGVLSPLLWLLAVNVILRQFESRGKKIVAYADDVVILVSGKFPSTITEIMQDALVELSDWARDKGLGVNPEKTELVLFTRKYKMEVFRLPVLNGVELKLSKEAKYLGIYLDSKLSWKKNIEERMKRGLNAYYTCRNSIGRNWGLQPRVVYWLYTSVVRPVITYGCIVWWRALRVSSYRKLLNKVQRCASLGITGALRSTPQASLDIILHLLPIENFVLGEAARSLIRISESGNLKIFHRGHADIINEAEIGYHVHGRHSSTDYMVTNLEFNGIPKVVIPDRSKWIGAARLFDGYSVFTDGSKMESGTGSGVYIPDKNIRASYRLPGDCSVFQAEILAILKSAQIIDWNIAAGQEITIYVDSQAALKALTGHSVTSRLVSACKESLRELSRKYNIRLCWVPGHCDVEGNEIADELARQGSSDQSLTVERSVKPPIGHYFGAIRKWILGRSSNNWTNRSDCRVSRALWPNLDKAGTRLILGLDKGTLRTIIGILTGHCHLRSRTFLWERGTPDFCRLCEEEEELETVEHIICHCPRLLNLRAKWLGNQFHDRLDDIPNCGLGNLVSYVREIRWMRARH